MIRLETLDGLVRSRALLLVAVLALPLLVIPRAASAMTFTVDTTADLMDPNLADVICGSGAGTCSLRAAIQEANDTPGADTIVVPGGDYEWFWFPGDAGDDAAVKGDLDITSDVTIVGQDYRVQPFDRTSIRVFTYDASDVSDRVFDVHPGANVTLRDLDIQGGNPSDTYAGGGIRNRGTLVLERDLIMSNYAGPTNGGFGGGIYNAPTGVLTLEKTSVWRNQVCTSVGFCSGGGIHNEGTLVVNDSSIIENEVTGVGGGIGNLLAGGTVTLSNATIAANEALGGGSSGGGLSAFSGGAWNVRNSIIADNTAPSGPDCDGSITSQGYNLVESISGCTVLGDTTGLQTGVDPLLAGPSYFNGTISFHLGDGSPARDAGNPAAPGSGGFACEASDHVFYPRSLGRTRCDLGALEASWCGGFVPPDLTGGACMYPTRAGKAALQVKDRADDAKGQLQWKLGAGSASDDADFGTGAAWFSLCGWDENTLVFEAFVPGGGTCNDKPRWKDSTKGIQYKDAAAAADGVRQIKIGSGVAGKSRLQVQGRGVNLVSAPLPWTGPVRVYALSTDLTTAGACFYSQFSTPTTNDGQLYKAKSD